MRVTTIDQLKTVIHDHAVAIIDVGKPGFLFTDFHLYIASRKFNHVDVMDFTVTPTIVDGILYSPTYIGIMYHVNEYGEPETRSTLDMNIPENHYNDWRCFTTREEADAYIVQNGPVPHPGRAFDPIDDFVDPGYSDDYVVNYDLSDDSDINWDNFVQDAFEAEANKPIEEFETMDVEDFLKALGDFIENHDDNPKAWVATRFDKNGWIV